VIALSAQFRILESLSFLRSYMLVKTCFRRRGILTPRLVTVEGCYVMRPALGSPLIRLFLLVSTAASSGLAQQPVPLEAPAGKRFAERFDRAWEHPTGTPLRCDLLHSEARLEFGQDYWSEYGFTVRLAQIDPAAGRDGMVGVRVTPLEPASRPTYFFSPATVPDVVPGVEVSRKIKASGGGVLNYGAGRYRVDWLFQLKNLQGCRASWTLRTGPAPELPGRLQAGEAGALDVKQWAGFPATPGGEPRRATILIHATPRRGVRDRVHIAPQDIAALMGCLRSLLATGRYNSARIVVFQFYRTSVVLEVNSLDPAGFRRVADALEAVDIGTIDVSTLQRANTRDDFLARLVLREERVEPPCQEVYLLGFARGFASSWSVDWPAGPKLPFRLSYLAITYQGQTPQDAISQLVRKAGGHVVAVYNPRQLGKFLRSMPATSPGLVDAKK
jgi:hypothetical protein